MLTFTEDGQTWKLEIDSLDVCFGDVSEEAHFAWSGCENCNDEEGRILGNDVHDCQVFPSHEHLMRGEYWEKSLCGKCLYEHHYGIGSAEA
jgi:hypothetical protein